MEFENFAYLLLMLVLLALSVIVSFKKEIQFHKQLKYLFPAILFSCGIFILWDSRFAELGIWQFNPAYITGFRVMRLPVEEWLFFLVIPYFCVYIYELVKTKSQGFEKNNFFVVVSLFLLIVFVALAYFERTKLYSFFTFFLLSIYFGYTVFRNRFKKHYTHFYLSFLISLVPFFIVKGILTGLPVIIYNEAHIIGPRIFTVPLEDFAFFFLMLLINVTIFEYLRQQRYY